MWMNVLQTTAVVMRTLNAQINPAVLRVPATLTTSATDSAASVSGPRLVCSWPALQNEGEL